ncbi:DNA-binding SARP family transcriptional activator [Anaerosolibacter carboniphilus]|uniref:DNA-binding SARP family transcriptional activator n=2 Tax=Anaerosolibacter carboniphilus TaxID=1417629 RepID=A0A841L327_9FIRM|nr:DNA-binding SARP family transcriptional activator [Anaerosolibacter carboniphilus]
MHSIQVKMLQAPMVFKDQEQVIFPFRKAEALFYYLVVNGQASRDELVDLLWGEVEEETAKKNLRHAMYKIRKAFDMDIIISPQKSLVMINPEIEIFTDLKQFMTDEEKGMDAYGGEFLQGFLVKDGEKFEEWMFRSREYYRDLYISKLYERMYQYREKGELRRVKYYGKLLVEVEPFDEGAYRMLMDAYGKEGAYHKAAELYKRLEATLKQELGITPDHETKAVYEDILGKRSRENTQREKQENKGFFYGRHGELRMLEKHYDRFIQGQKVPSVLIIGEAGIGKTKLKERFLEEVSGEDTFILQANCYQAEEIYPLKPWHQIFMDLGEIVRKEKIMIPLLWRSIVLRLFPGFDPEATGLSDNPVEGIDRVKYHTAEEAILGIMKKIALKKKILLVFEDTQWMDATSIGLLSFVLRHQGQNRIMLVGTCRNGHDKRIEQFVTNMVKDQLLDKIELTRFTKEEVADFIEKALPGREIEKEIKERIYHETEGNAFFLIELLKTMEEKGTIGEISGTGQDILKSRIVDITEEGMKLLNIAALFFDRVTLDMLQTISGKDELEILDRVEELQRRYILKEVEQNEEISFEFTHHKLREFIYGLQSPGRKKVLHHRIGQILEQNLQNDYRDKFIYSKLIYHFSNGGNRLAALKYRIKHLDEYSDFSHELFPILYDENMEDEKIIYLNQEESMKYLNDLELQLKDVQKTEKDQQGLAKLEIAFYHTKGRYCIQEGEYSQGIEAIQKMIQGAERIADDGYMLKGYRQMVYYGIQVHQTTLMQEYLTKGIALARKMQHQKEMGIFLRLQGLQRLMIGAYEEAEEILKESIHIFEMLSQREDRYTLNIAAAYNYMGEIRRYNMKFASALHYYDKAMDICNEKKVFRGITLFNTNAGQAAFDMGDYDRAKNYFTKAIETYRQVDTFLGRSTAEGYMALLLIREGKYQEALDSLKNAEEYGKKLQSPYEQGLIYRVKAEIRGQMVSNDRIRKVFEKHLQDTVEVYCDQGINLLKKAKNCYEIDILKALGRGKG